MLTGEKYILVNNCILKNSYQCRCIEYFI